MIVVIQCAASKRADAGRLLTSDRKRVEFVAQPRLAPAQDEVVYARPDDLAEGGASWRDLLLKYNAVERGNPLGLLPAWQLYDNRTYGRLVERFGVEKVYILSAGWGLVGAEFLTPYYDITYSQSADGYKRRKKTDRYGDFRMLPDQTSDDVVFLGGKDYLPLFCDLTAAVRGKRTVFYNSGQTPSVPGCSLRRFETRTRTNWHYECANALVEGGIRLDMAD